MSSHLWVVRLVRTDADGVREQLDSRVIRSPQAAGLAMAELREAHRGERAGAEMVVEPSFMNEAGVDDWAQEGREVQGDAERGRRPFGLGVGPVSP